MDNFHKAALEVDAWIIYGYGYVLEDFCAHDTQP
jgi:hypothetical protein